MPAANAMRGEAPLGDFTLIYTFNTMCLLEQLTGMKTTNLLVMMQGNMGFGDIRHFVWAGLQEKHEDVSLEEAGDLVGEHGPDAALKAVSEAMTLCFGTRKKEKGKNPPKAA